MEKAIFADGVPLRITVQDIRRWHLASFPDLAEEENTPIIEEAIDAVYVMFSGSETLFDMHPKQVWYNKTRILFRWLTCWYIASNYPMFVASAETGNVAVGSMPLRAKKIGPITLTYQDQFVKGQNPDYQNLLSSLQLNSWGRQAYDMIRSSAKRLLYFRTSGV